MEIELGSMSFEMQIGFKVNFEFIYNLYYGYTFIRRNL